MRGAARAVVSFLATLAVLVVVWEGYKAMGQATGGVWPGTTIDLPVRTNQRSMPHTWDIVGSLFAPARRGGEDILLVILARAALWTWRSAAIGFVVGSLVGFGLGVLFVRSLLAERGLMPYVVASQAVPVLAIAPILVVWSGRLALPNWVPISVISAYLAFYPVAINTLRGLRSPEATSMELMRSYAASPGQVLWKLQVPASLPYLFPALKISASASIIGAIVGELPAGFPQGLGRAILSFASSFSSAPEKLFASVLVSALLGLGFVGVVALAERLAVPEAIRQRDDTEPGAGMVPATATGAV
ncbi:MAG TPA: ABC transporter permease subunit [Acidimicrobiia bacterium]|nr:ABC transporter permease subunit [Acidimicrobiia bacterium]